MAAFSLTARRPASLLFTGAGALLLAFLAWKIGRWALLDATWTGASAKDCGENGACWAVLGARYRLILFGLYPIEEQWRAALACLIVVAAVLLFQWPRLWETGTLALGIGATSAVFLALMYGGVLGLTFVPTDRWGGLALTIYLFVCGVLIGLPLGVALALLRRSKRPAVSASTAFAVDAVRTLPMVTILFSIAVLAPVAFPDWLLGDKLWRVALAFAFAYACYQSEIVRAGLQAIPFSQEETASALGLGAYYRMRLILLPQAIANGLPATINLLVATFKETSIVAIIGFFDFTASAEAAYGNAEWANAYVEVYLFIGATYFLCASGIAWLGRRIEMRRGPIRS
jgi:general L-amino acid transport system permease protein